MLGVAGGCTQQRDTAELLGPAALQQGHVQDRWGLGQKMWLQWAFVAGQEASESWDDLLKLQIGFLFSKPYLCKNFVGLAQNLSLQFIYINV